MRKSIRNILLSVAVLVLVGIIYGYYQYSRGNRDLATTSADIFLPASTLAMEYSTNENNANKKFLNKVISVRGKVKSIETDSTGVITIYLETDDPLSGVSCQLDKQHNDQAKGIQPGASISIIGVCTGFLSDVVLVRCSVQHAKL